MLAAFFEAFFCLTFERKIRMFSTGSVFAAFFVAFFASLLKGK
jgi:hypothetical protein